jgi:hypothetical protein
MVPVLHWSLLRDDDDDYNVVTLDLAGKLE